MKILKTVMATLWGAAILCPVAAQDNNTGKSRIFGAWEVVCPAKAGNRPCSLLQQQATTDAAGKKQRLLAIELKPAGEMLQGTMILPFGLDLSKGAQLHLPGELGSHHSFKTCLPVGCLVDVSFASASISALSGAEKIEVEVTSQQSGQTTMLTIMLEGFADALAAVRSGDLN
ncbi:MAG: invasion associated locus B family protein [Mesorhizobium sp.]